MFRKIINNFDKRMKIFEHMKSKNLNISENEKSVLKILYEYFKLYPNEYFYSEEEWFYDKNNIERIYFENPYDSKWCYRNPKEKR